MGSHCFISAASIERSEVRGQIAEVETNDSGFYLCNLTSNL